MKVTYSEEIRLSTSSARGITFGLTTTAEFESNIMASCVDVARLTGTLMGGCPLRNPYGQE